MLACPVSFEPVEMWGLCINIAIFLNSYFVKPELKQNICTSTTSRLCRQREAKLQKPCHCLKPSDKKKQTYVKLKYFCLFLSKLKRKKDVWFAELKLAEESSTEVFHCKHIYRFWMEKSGNGSSARFAGTSLKMCNV